MRKKSPQADHRLGRWTAILSALRHRNYRHYWFGQLFSVLAQNMEIVAQSWLVLQLTNSPLFLGLTGLTHAIPMIALTLVGGAIADRADRRRIMILTQGAIAFFFFILATLVVTGEVRLWHVLAFAFISGSLRAFDRPSRMALLPQMVPREDMANAVALAGTIWQLNKLIGPAVAGMLIYLFDVGPTYFACASASLTAFVLWNFIEVDRHSFQGGPSGLIQRMMEGLNFIRGNEIFSTFIALIFFNGLFGMSYSILMPIFARDILQVGSQGYGFLHSAAGAGALGGTLLVAATHRSGRTGRRAILGAILFGAVIIGFAFSQLYPLSLVLVFLIGLAGQFYMTVISTVLQLSLPEQFRGRVMGIYGLAWDVIPIGGTISGTMAEYIGAPLAVALGGFLVMGTAVAVALFRPHVRELE